MLVCDTLHHQNTLSVGEIVNALRMMHYVFHAGCSTAKTPPQAGDIRLVATNPNGTATESCDEVHWGDVQIYFQGRWGYICSQGGPETMRFDLDARVICRQLGFPFGTPVDTDVNVFPPIRLEGPFPSPPPPLSILTWANDVRSPDLVQYIPFFFFSRSHAYLMTEKRVGGSVQQVETLTPQRVLMLRFAPYC